MLKLATRTGLLALVIAMAACGGAEDRKSAYFEKGQALFKEGNFEKARLEFKNVLQIDPKDVPARYALAETLEKLQDWRGAAGHYLAVIEADPKHKEALAKMGQIYLLSRNSDEAQKLADKLLAMDATDPEGLTLQAGLKALKQDVAGAVADVKTALEKHPGHVNASALLASLYLQTGKPDESIETLKKVLEKEPGNVTVKTILARVYAQLGKNQEARETFTDIIKQEPQVLGHRLRFAQFTLGQKDLDTTEETLRKAVDELKDDTKQLTAAKLSLIEFLAKNRSGDKAIESLEGMVKAEPDNDELRNALGKVYEAANQLDKAKGIYQGIIDGEEDQKSPQALAAKTRLAVVTGRAGDRAGAKTLIEEVLKDNPRDKDALVLRGTLTIDEGDAASAIADFRAALKNDPSAIDLNRLLARAHLVNKEPQLAIDTLRKALEANPQDITMRADLANIYSSQKDLESAVAQLEDILKVAPTNREAFEGIFKVRMFEKDFAKAHEVATRLKTAMPEDPSGFYFDGLAFQADNKLPESIEQFESALAVSPDAIQPLSQLIKSHLAMDKADVAEKRLAEVIEQNPKNFVAHNLTGEIQLASKRYEDAKKSFESALALNANWAILYRNLAATQLGLKQEDDAIATMEKGIEATKGSALLVTALATYLEKIGKLDDAIAQYEKVLKENPESDLGLNNLAMLLIEYKSDDASKNRAKELVGKIKDLNQAAYLDTIGWVAFKTGDYQKAVESLEKAVQAAPDAAIMRYHLGMAYHALGNDVLAKDNLKQAVEGAQEYRGLTEAKATLAKLEGTK